MGRVLINLLVAAVCIVGIVGTSLAVSGTPLFGLLGGTGIQVALTPAPFERAPPDSARSQGPVEVPVARVDQRIRTHEQTHSGRLVALQAVTLRARVTGYLENRTFRETAFVEAGTELFQLDPRPFEARIAELEATLEGARARRDFLQSEVERVEALQEDNFATESRLDELQSQRVDAAATVAETEARLRSARLDLDFTTIVAPFAGRTGFADADPGDLVTAGETRLTELIQYDPIAVEFRPSAAELAAIDAATAATDAPLPLRLELEGRDEPVTGELLGRDAAFEVTTNTVRMRGEVANADHALVPGQFARVTLQLGERRELTVPTEALITDQTRRAVYRVSEDNRAEVVPVETGATVDGRVAVAGALRPDDRIIVGNLQAVRPDAPVQPMPAEGDRQAAAEREGAE